MHTQGCSDRVALEAAAEELRGFLEEVQVEEEEALFEVWKLTHGCLQSTCVS